MKRYTYTEVFDKIKSEFEERLNNGETILADKTELAAQKRIAQYHMAVKKNPKNEKMLRIKLRWDLRNYKYNGQDVIDIFPLMFHYSGGELMCCDLNTDALKLDTYKKIALELIKKEDTLDYILNKHHELYLKTWFTSRDCRRVTIEMCKLVIRQYVDYMNLKRGYKPMSNVERKRKERGGLKKEVPRKKAIKLLKQGRNIKDVVNETGLGKSTIYRLRDKQSSQIVTKISNT